MCISNFFLFQIDKDGASPERVMQELSSIGLMPEDWGGDVPMVQVWIQTFHRIFVSGSMYSLESHIMPPYLLLTDQCVERGECRWSVGNCHACFRGILPMITGLHEAKKVISWCDQFSYDLGESEPASAVFLGESHKFIVIVWIFLYNWGSHKFMLISFLRRKWTPWSISLRLCNFVRTSDKVCQC